MTCSGTPSKAVDVRFAPHLAFDITIHCQVLIILDSQMQEMSDAQCMDCQRLQRRNHNDAQRPLNTSRKTSEIRAMRSGLASIQHEL